MPTIYLRSSLLLCIYLIFLQFNESTCQIPTTTVTFDLGAGMIFQSLHSSGYDFSKFQIRKKHPNGRTTTDAWLCYENECWGRSVDNVVVNLVDRKVAFIARLENVDGANVLKEYQNPPFEYPMLPAEGDTSNGTLERINQEAPSNSQVTATPSNTLKDQEHATSALTVLPVKANSRVVTAPTGRNSNELSSSAATLKNAGQSTNAETPPLKDSENKESTAAKLEGEENKAFLNHASCSIVGLVIFTLSLTLIFT
ncbi:hypothetical protein HMI54_015580 [Coelomomyces lativittatus]|nr:hypothetical protein HMI56_002961 [Coelomomyces lativittatus]KAJ1504106.1 hypothetical protein HMI55_002163 [Coelomomyces lativittatus]KAJ1512655.1 hypothetical protein HMI54_015580 [Coelomomyces lativittatus]